MRDTFNGKAPVGNCFPKESVDQSGVTTLKAE
jgi:hypothetical protein